MFLSTDLKSITYFDRQLVILWQRSALACAMASGKFSNEDITNLSLFMRKPQEHRKRVTAEQKAFLRDHSERCLDRIQGMATEDELFKGRAYPLLRGATPDPKRALVDDLAGDRSIVRLLKRIEQGVEPGFVTAELDAAALPAVPSPGRPAPLVVAAVRPTPNA